MRGKELLERFSRLSGHKQTEILVKAFGQIADAIAQGRAYAPFNWRDCRLDDDRLSIEVPASDLADEVTILRNYKDYAALIYCLTTASSSAESMNWDAGRKIKPPVLREIVLTLCGRNNSVEPLIRKLQEPYIDEDTFFSGYSTVDEKEGRDAFEKKQRIDAENRAYDYVELQANTTPRKSWGEKIAIFLILVACFGGYRAYKATKEAERRQAYEQTLRMQDERRQRQQYLRKHATDLADKINGRVKSQKVADVDTTSLADQD